MNFNIKEPIWKTRSVGLSEDKLEEDNTVNILYKNRLGEREYPHTYKITRQEAMSNSLMVVKGVRLRVVPIMSLGIQWPSKK